VDPPRPAARAAGDHAITAGAIAKELGIRGRAISGAQFAEMTDEQAHTEIDEIGVIARVTPEQKVRLVDILKGKGHVVAMTGDGVDDAPALKQADIGIAMGITGTEVSKEAAAMVLTGDNFATIVKAVELGRGLYDNLVKYIRFQMGVLAGLWVTLRRREHPEHRQRHPAPAAPDAVGQLHHAGVPGGRPRLRTAQRRADAAPPRKPEQPILLRDDTVWFVVAGLVMAAVTLAVIAGAEHSESDGLARTMGLTTFSLANLFLSFTARDKLLGVQPRHALRPDVPPPAPGGAGAGGRA
jgi:Ca2+-transporting ATPase